MSPSKLDKYLCVLRALTIGPQRLDRVAYVAKMECNAVKNCLDFLVSHDLVEERRLKSKRVLYAINERGWSVFKTLRALKFLEKLKKTLPVVEESQEIATVIPKPPRRLKEQ